MKRVIAFIMITLSLCVSCMEQAPIPERNDFIGTWIPEDGGIIVLNEDSTCYVKLPSNSYIISFCDVQTDSVEFFGKWALSLSKGQRDWPTPYKIDIHSDSAVFISNYDFDSKLRFALYIVGENGLFSFNRPPWYLFEFKMNDDFYKVKRASN